MTRNHKLRDFGNQLYFFLENIRLHQRRIQAIKSNQRGSRINSDQELDATFDLKEFLDYSGFDPKIAQDLRGLLDVNNQEASKLIREYVTAMDLDFYSNDPRIRENTLSKIERDRINFMCEPFNDFPYTVKLEK
jgi:hypothetical protein